MKSYVRNKINLSCAKILLTSVIKNCALQKVIGCSGLPVFCLRDSFLLIALRLLNCDVVAADCSLWCSTKECVVMLPEFRL